MVAVKADPMAGMEGCGRTAHKNRPRYERLEVTLRGKQALPFTIGDRCVGHVSNDSAVVRRGNLPNGPRGILRHELVRGGDGQAVNDGLADEHSIKGIPVQCRKPSGMEGRLFIEG